MSERLELTGEQAKALREWWRSANLRNGKPECGAEDNERRLRDALRPLFEPWRVDGHDPCRIIGPEGIVLKVVDWPDAPGAGIAIGQRVCAALNAAERGEPS